MNALHPNVPELVEMDGSSWRDADLRSAQSGLDAGYARGAPSWPAYSAPTRVPVLPQRPAARQPAGSLFSGMAPTDEHCLPGSAPESDGSLAQFVACVGREAQSHVEMDACCR